MLSSGGYERSGVPVRPHGCPPACPSAHRLACRRHGLASVGLSDATPSGVGALCEGGWGLSGEVGWVGVWVWRCLSGFALLNPTYGPARSGVPAGMRA
jgi:hypothetical protein